MTHVPPRVKLPMTYRQTVRPPFAVSMMPDGLYLSGFEDLTEAIDEFVRYCIPPLEGRTVSITDADGVLVIGYHSDPLATEPLRWFGTVWAVEEMRRHRLVEPLLMASVEMALESP